MKKSIRLLFLLILILSNLYSEPSYKNISLSEFASSVAISNKINIFIDEDLSKENISFYIPNIKDPKTLLTAFKVSLDKKNLLLMRTGEFYYISKKEEYKKNNYLIKLNNNCSSDFIKYLKMMSLKYIYLQSNNTFFIKCNKFQKKDIDKFLQNLDKQAKQVVLKFIVLSYDDSNVKEHGIEFSTLFKGIDGTIQAAANTLLFPLSSANNIISSTSFYGALRLLNTANIVKVNQYPYILVKNNNNFTFKSVQNIPYLVKTTVTDSSTVSENNSYEYRDVGLKIKGKAFIYDGFITLNIDLTVEDVLSVSGDTPSTNKRYLNSITNLKIGQVLLLSGIKQDKVENTNIKIPILSGIPLLGKMFEYSYKTHSKSNITIAIQVLSSDSASPSLLSSEVRTSSKEAKPLGYL